MNKYILLKTKVILSIVMVFLLNFSLNIFNITIPKLIINNTIIIEYINILIVLLLISYIVCNIYISTKFSSRKSSVMVHNLVDDILIVAIFISLSSKGFFLGIVSVILFVNLILMVVFNIKKSKKMNVCQKTLAILTIIITLLNDLPLSLLGFYSHNILIIVVLLLYLYDILNLILTSIKPKNKINAEEKKDF